MCITNEVAEKTLKAIRAYENGSKDEKSLAECLALIKNVQECLEISEKKIKIDLKENYSGEIHYFPDVNKKVYLSEGRSLNSYDIESIHKKLAPETFFKIVNIVAKRVEELGDEEIIQIVEENKIKEYGEPYITVYKMNKKELIEHKA